MIIFDPAIKSCPQDFQTGSIMFKDNSNDDVDSGDGEYVLRVGSRARRAGRQYGTSARLNEEVLAHGGITNTVPSHGVLTSRPYAVGQYCITCME